MMMTLDVHHSYFSVHSGGVTMRPSFGTQLKPQLQHQLQQLQASYSCDFQSCDQTNDLCLMAVLDFVGRLVYVHCVVEYHERNIFGHTFYKRVSDESIQAQELCFDIESRKHKKYSHKHDNDDV